MRGKIITGLVAGAGALLLGMGTASATVTFDPSNGTGFVGKGDVQTAFGWNNQKAQSLGPYVTFSYDSTDVYSATCEFVTGAGTRGEQTHDVSISRHTGVSGTVDYTDRKHQQYDGYILTGFVPGSTVTTGTVPVAGDTCVATESDGIARNGVWIDTADYPITLVSSTGGLSVTSGGVSVQLQ